MKKGGVRLTEVALWLKLSVRDKRCKKVRRTKE